MSAKLGIGMESFEEIREIGAYYVDKTELISDLLENDTRKSKVTLFTRPRRFGKTLTMTMLRSFFDIRRDSKEIFAGLAVAGHEELCARWMNQYPTLFLTLKGVDGLDFDSAYARLKALIAEVCIELEPFIDWNKVSEAYRASFDKLVRKEASKEEVMNSLYLITCILRAVYNKKVVLLIDEYDVPLAKASEWDLDRKDFYPQMVDVIRGLFDTAMKTNEHLELAVLTGCLRISKESIFTGMNNFACYSILDTEFSEYFGFTEAEVREILRVIGSEESYENVRQWYDGYIFGKSHVFCPWDVVCYLAALQNDREASPKNYWRNTSGNGILLTFVSRSDFDVSDKFETLLNGGTIRQRVYDELTYDSLHDSEENLWSLLLMTGYVTKVRPGAEGDEVELRLPNREIGNLFADTVVKHFKASLDTASQRELLEALWNGEEEKASELMTDILFTTISYHDYHENYYHAFLTGLLTGMGYAVKSNQENGLGRTDIDIREKKKRRAMIIEAKKSSSVEDMEKDALAGVKQIVDREYLKGFEGYKSVLGYGVAFFRKMALVKKLS